MIVSGDGEEKRGRRQRLVWRAALRLILIPGESTMSLVCLRTANSRGNEWMLEQLRRTDGAFRRAILLGPATSEENSKKNENPTFRRDPHRHPPRPPPQPPPPPSPPPPPPPSPPPKKKKLSQPPLRPGARRAPPALQPHPLPLPPDRREAPWREGPGRRLRRHG